MLYSRKRIREGIHHQAPSSSDLISVEKIDWKKRENKYVDLTEQRSENVTSIPQRCNDVVVKKEPQPPTQNKSSEDSGSIHPSPKEISKEPLKEKKDTYPVTCLSVERRKNKKFLIENEDVWKDLEAILVTKRKGIYLLSGGCGRGKTYGIEFVLNKMNIKKLECNTENVERGVGDEMKDMIRSNDVNMSRKQVVVEDLDGWSTDQLKELKTLKTVDAPILVTCVNPYSPSLRNYRDMFDKVWKLKDVTKRSLYSYASYLSPKSDPKTLTNAVESCRGDLRQLEFSLLLHTEKDLSPIDPLDATRKMMCGKPSDVRRSFSHHDTGFMMWMGWSNYNSIFDLETCTQYADFFSLQDLLWKDESCIQEMITHLPKTNENCNVKWGNKPFHQIRNDVRSFREEDTFSCLLQKSTANGKKKKG
jgi:hypothetical protein